MPRESVVYGLAVALIAVGLTVLVYGEYIHVRSMIPVGGVLALAGVAIIAGSIIRM